MAAYAYLVDPEKQFMTKSGTINVAGFLRVYDASTDDRVITYQDFQGTENEFEIKLDNNGRAIVIADSARVYRLEVYDRYGSLQWTTSPLWCLAAGGGAAIHRTDVVSTDGSLAVDKVEVGSTTTFDLSTHVQDGDDLIEAIRCDGAEVVQGTDIYRPIYTAGTMEVGDKGLILIAGRYYHVTAHVKATKSVQRDPFYDEVNIRFVIDDGETQTDSVVSKRIVDYSLGLSQEFEVSTDVIPETDCELLLVIDGHDVQNGSFELLDLEAHRVYSGAPYIPSGVLSRAQAADIYQEKLIAGDNITIEGNVISATGDFEQVQSDWTETDTTADSFIRHKPQTKPVVAGQNIVIDETSTQFVISATAEPQEQANWNESDPSSVQYIQNKPDLSVYATTQAMNTALAGKQDVISDLATIRSGAALGATATQPSDLAAGLATKQDTLTAGANINIQNNVISATAEPQQQADWAEADSSSVQYIQHKPDLSVYATGSELTAGLATKQDVISDLATIRSGAAAGATAVQPADLAPYATTSDMNTALAGKQDTLTAGANIDITNNVISATAEPQVQADWAQTDSSEVDYIKNKPDLSVYATTSAMNTALAGKQDVISDLSDIRAGAALGDTAVQPADLATVATTGDYDDLTDKPDLSIYAESADLATVATTGSYADLTNTPSIPTATSDLTNDSGYITSAEAPVQDVTVNGNSVLSNGVAAVTVPTATSDLTNDSNFITLADVPAQAQANWLESDTSAASYIQNKPINLVQDANYVHTDENFTSAEKSKLAGIAAGAEVNVQADWAETDNSSDAYIANKPDLSVYATGSELTAGLATKQDTISDLATIRSGAAAGATAVQPSSLATVATTGSYNDLSNKPTIPTVDQTYNAASANAQSGAAVAQAIAAIPPYTAGDGIDIIANEVSVKVGNGLEIGNATEEFSGSQTFQQGLSEGAYSYYMHYLQLNADLVDAIENGGLTVTLDSNFGNPSNVFPVIVDTNYDFYSSGGIFFGATSSAVSPGAVLNISLADRNETYSTLNFNTVKSNPTSYLLTFAAANEYAKYVVSGRAPSTVPSITTEYSYTKSVQNAVNVSNPLPASTSADADKVLTVDAQGTPAWAAAQAPITAGNGIDITNDVVSVDTSVVATQTDLSGKQDTLTAGTNVSISNNVISATDTTYTAGVGIDITSNTITADIDNSTIVPETNTVTGALTETDETAEGDYNSLLDSTLSNIFNSNSQAQVTIHIPGDTFDCGPSPLSASHKVAVCLTPMIDENNKWTTQGSFYIAADLTASYDESNDTYVLDEQDVTVSAPVSSPDWYDWKSANNQPTATYYAMTFAIYTPGHESEQTPVFTFDLGETGHIVTYSLTTATNKICVANPVPASTSADEGKCLVVDSNGDPEWGTGGKVYTGTDGVVVDNVNDTVGLEAPVDIVAGPGIHIDNPDGNTLRVSQQYPTDETVLWSGSVAMSGNPTLILSESCKNFEYIAIYGHSYSTWGEIEFVRINPTANPNSNESSMCVSNLGSSGAAIRFNQCHLNWGGLTTIVVTLAKQFSIESNGTYVGTAASTFTKVVGIHRIANN